MYGLGGSVWTSDPERGRSIARRVRTGTIGVNRHLPDIAAPFGGVKSSGHGRDLGPEALAAHLETKSIYVCPPPTPGRVARSPPLRPGPAACVDDGPGHPRGVRPRQGPSSPACVARASPLTCAGGPGRSTMEA
ncbi:aldehyde dehydrogenase family protein [Streptomyces sp. NPDC008122]|uniref:aldehyde dehydrogenase family protein n=1 Tax=Streptomyces sp. NPDC008122 TaxID=3364810 RepID=UPI0036ED7610